MIKGPRVVLLVFLPAVAWTVSAAAGFQAPGPARRAGARAVSLSPVVRSADRFAVSRPVRGMRVGVPTFRGDREIPERRRERAVRRGPDTADPVVQGVAPPAAIPAPLASFEGIDNQDNFAVYGGYIVPPDTVGDIG